MMGLCYSLWVDIINCTLNVVQKVRRLQRPITNVLCGLIGFFCSLQKAVASRLHGLYKGCTGLQSVSSQAHDTSMETGKYLIIRKTNFLKDWINVTKTFFAGIWNLNITVLHMLKPSQCTCTRKSQFFSLNTFFYILLATASYPCDEQTRLKR